MVNELKIFVVNFIFQMKNPFWNTSKSLLYSSFSFQQQKKTDVLNC